MMTKSSNIEVARRAYELFLSRGAGHGLDLQDWLEAERQLTAGTERPAKKSAATSSRRRSLRR
jgi:hypothetical protein